MPPGLRLNFKLHIEGLRLIAAPGGNPSPDRDVGFNEVRGQTRKSPARQIGTPGDSPGFPFPAESARGIGDSLRISLFPGRIGNRGFPPRFPAKSGIGGTGIGDFRVCESRPPPAPGGRSDLLIRLGALRVSGPSTRAGMAGALSVRAPGPVSGEQAQWDLGNEAELEVQVEWQALPVFTLKQVTGRGTVPPARSRAGQVYHSAEDLRSLADSEGPRILPLGHQNLAAAREQKNGNKTGYPGHSKFKALVWEAAHRASWALLRSPLSEAGQGSAIILPSSAKHGGVEGALRKKGYARSVLSGNAPCGAAASRHLRTVAFSARSEYRSRFASGRTCVR